MGDIAIKKRIIRAKRKAEKDLINIGYKIIPSDNSSFCILGTRRNEVRFIRVVIDEVTQDDIRLVEDYEFPGSCVKEIWCKRIGQKEFDIKEI